MGGGTCIYFKCSFRGEKKIVPRVLSSAGAGGGRRMLHHLQSEDLRLQDGERGSKVSGRKAQTES